jgi:hypothetical protein
MTNSSGSVAHDHTQADTRLTARPAPEATRHQNVTRLVMLAAAARLVVSKRTLQGIIVLAIGVTAASRLAKEQGTSGLDWYLKRAVQKVSDKTEVLKVTDKTDK